MKNKIVQIIPAAIVLAAIGFRYLSQWCINSVPSCYGTWVHQIALEVTKPLYFFTLYLLPIAILLIFVSRPVFNSWIKWAVWLMPLALIFIATQPVSPQSYLSTNRDDAARLAGQVFIALSLTFIIWKHYSLRRAKP